MRLALASQVAALLVGVAACRSTSPLIARSSAGALDRLTFERDWPATARATPEARRRTLEDWLIERALAREARRLALDRTDAAREALARAADDVFVGQVEADVEAGLKAPDEAALAAFLERNRAQIAGAEKLSLRHVFKRLPRDASDDQRATARAGMQALRARLVAGEDFATLARTLSDSETAKFGGQITPVARGQLPPAAEAVAWRLAPGEISDVVDTPVGLHVFRLEARLPPAPLTLDEARAWARHRLGSETRAAARDARRELWRAQSGALYRPQVLADAHAPEALVFALDGLRLTSGDLDARRAALGFAGRRLRTSRELLDEVAWRRLAVWHARRVGIDRAPATRRALLRARERALAQLAAQRRTRIWSQRRPESELRALFDVDPMRFADQALERVRVVVLARRPGRTLDQAFALLGALASDVRAGRRELAAAARELSDDPSAADGGDLGFVTRRALQEWAGPTCAERLANQAPGEVGTPLLVESYREARLEYEASAYVLARVEERRGPRAPRFEDVRDEVAAVYAQRHWQTADAALRADVLRESGARFFEPEAAR